MFSPTVRVVNITQQTSLLQYILSAAKLILDAISYSITKKLILPKITFSWVPIKNASHLIDYFHRLGKPCNLRKKKRTSIDIKILLAINMKGKN